MISDAKRFVYIAPGKRLMCNDSHYHFKLVRAGLGNIRDIFLAAREIERERPAEAVRLYGEVLRANPAHVEASRALTRLRQPEAAKRAPRTRLLVIPLFLAVVSGAGGGALAHSLLVTGPGPQAPAKVPSPSGAPAAGPAALDFPIPTLVPASLLPAAGTPRLARFPSGINQGTGEFPTPAVLLTGNVATAWAYSYIESGVLRYTALQGKAPADLQSLVPTFLPYLPGNPGGGPWVYAGGRLEPPQGVSYQPISLRVDLPSRTLTLMLGQSPLFLTPAAVGAPESPTPTGAFSVTGVYRTGGPYGPYLLDLSLAHYAVHGTGPTTAVGAAISAGCVRVPNAAAASLAALVPPGAQVSIGPAKTGLFWN